MNTPGRETVFGFDFGSFDCRIHTHGRVRGAGESDLPPPNEVMIRGNLISVDPTYVDGAFIWKLLLDPNGYEPRRWSPAGGWVSDPAESVDRTRWRESVRFRRI